MITRYKAADPLDPTSQAEYKVLAAGAQRYWHGTRAAFEQVKNSIPNNTMICITDDNDAPSDNAPIGSVFAYYGSTSPDGYLICDGSTFDTSLYPDLYLFLGSDTLPDLRECTLVGVGQNTTHTIANHDEYTLGQFKDDQLQDHVHNAGHDINSVQYSHVRYNASVSKGYDFSEMLARSPTTGRHGDVTHGKQVGVNYIIKATSNMSKSDASALLAQVIQHMTPDYAHQKTITGNTWTADEDVWISYTNSYTSGASPYPLYADGVEISTATTNSRTHSFAGRISKGTVLSATGLNSTNFKAWPFK